MAGPHPHCPQRQPAGQQHPVHRLGELVKEEPIHHLAQGLGAQGQGEHTGHHLAHEALWGAGLDEGDGAGGEQAAPQLEQEEHPQQHGVAGQGAGRHQEHGPAGQQAKADAAQHPGQGAQPQAFPQRRNADAAQNGRHAQGAFHPLFCLPFCHTNTSKKL